MKTIHQESAAHEWAFFAASNSRNGFHSYYESCFRDAVDTLYVIKGGPGTGKSRLMREIANEGVARGWRPEYYYCSSDPTSLDAVLLYEEGGRSVGLLDGTAPHTMEPVLPGVREELVDLGRFWSSRALQENEEAIRLLAGQKSEGYRAAYRYLRAAGECMDNKRAALLPCLAAGRVERLATRLMASLPPTRQKSTAQRIALRSSVGMQGQYTLATYEQQARRTVYLQDYYGTAYELSAALLAVARARGVDALLSYHPVCPDRVDALYFPAAQLAFIVCEHTPTPASTEKSRVLDLRRLVVPELVRLARPSLRAAARGYEQMLENACHCMESVSRAHFSLESIYSAAMDFEAKERYTVQLIGRIFGG